MSRTAFIILALILEVGLPVAIVTNGITDIQLSRLALSSLKDYVTKAVISEEGDISKPCSMIRR